MYLREGDLIGIPWKAGGRSLDGADCLGLAILAQLAITGHDYRGVVDLNGDTDETILELSHLIPRFIERYMTPCTALRHGNIMLFRFADSIHMGTYFAGGKILHVMPGYTSRLNAYGRYFKEREIGLYRGR